MFPAIDKSETFPSRELDILKLWQEQDIYHKTLRARAEAPPFVFYEGPPTANGMPHPGHCLTRAIKDLFPRYKTMRGYRCERKAGWDTHGLPVEVEVCKELGIHSKEEIEAHGIEPFIQKCQQSVWRYMNEWERLTERLGFWVDLENAYVTYHQSYVESVWWSLKNLYDRGLLYRGHKIVWWWAQGGTALSAGEVGQGYRQVADPSVYVKFPIAVDEKAKELGLDENTSLLVWTTTPWTLPSNQFAAVHPDLDYITFPLEPSSSETVLVAKSLAAKILLKWVEVNFTRAKGQSSDNLDSQLNAGGSYELEDEHSTPEAKVAYYRKLLKEREIEAKLKTFEALLDKIAGPSIRGSELIGLRYVPPFDWYYQQHQAREGKLGKLTLEASDGEELREMAIRMHLVQSGISKESVETILSQYKSSEGTSVGWRIVPAGFVTTESGTGVVHIAPAFGEIDYEVFTTEQVRFVNSTGPMLINAVGPDGKFTEEGPDYCVGRWVKDCDKDITRDLKQRGLLFHQEQYLHDYPFCWRAEEDPLIQYPRESWFIRTTEFKDRMLENNSAINWLPEHIKDGRFGKFLESNVDWALSRERYWGTPLPIWVCSETGQMEAVGNYEELLAKPQAAGFKVWEKAKKANPELPDDLRIHKPYIDAVTYASPFAEGATMQRVTEVIDCWYDSGAMPFAQWGYRGQETGPERERFESQFPADFISEAIDQTRGWFYSQLAISTMMFGEEALGARRQALEPESTSASQLAPSAYPHPFKNCIVLGLMLGEDGQKMSKSKRNYREPQEIFDRYGADALRWYLFANQPPWTSIRYSEEAIKDSIPEFLLRLWNVFSFFTIYANIDEFDPGEEPGVLGSRGDWSLQRPVQGELDRWILGELHRMCAIVVERMDAYDNFGACQAITDFVDGLSNWYVRRSRDRFWAKDKRSTDKLDAYWTLYECLVTTTQVIAPFVPFLAERLWQDLVVAVEKGTASSTAGVPESVHLCDFPEGDASKVDSALSEQMELVRLISSLGRQARSAVELKVRQPLAKVEVILADTTHREWLEAHASVIADELNVKAVEFTDEAEKYVDYLVLPNFKALGPKLGKLMPKVKGALAKESGAELLDKLREHGEFALTIDDQKVALTSDEIEVRIEAKEGWTSANDKGVVVVLATEVTEELRAEGLSRDVVRIIQEQRKMQELHFTDRIILTFGTDSIELKNALTSYSSFIKAETLADDLKVFPYEEVDGFDHLIPGNICFRLKIDRNPES